MSPRKRFGIPTETDAEIGARLKQLRIEYGFSRTEIGAQIGLTADQIKRIETAKVSLRFGPGWRLCEFTKTNPLWLAFGEIHPRIGFAPYAPRASDASADEGNRFQEVMVDWADKYAQRRTRFFKTSADTQRIFAEVRLGKLNFLAETGVKRYLAHEMAASMTWPDLRERLSLATASKGARTALARSFRVTSAAVSQWLSGKAAPKADTTLRLLQWVTAEEAKQKSAPALRSTRPAQKTRKRKSKHEKPRSDRKKR